MFDFKLYKEGLRRLRIAWLAILILTLTASLILPIMIPDYPTFLVDTEKSLTFYVSSPLLSIAVFAPVMVYAEFGFLLKRRECDVFHAIAPKRKTVFFSFFTAWLTRILETVVICELASALMWTLTHHAAVSIPYLLTELLQMTVLALFCGAFTFIAIMLFGTPAASVLISICMFGIPPIVGTLMSECMSLVPGLDSSFFDNLTFINYYPVQLVNHDDTTQFSLIPAAVFSAVAFVISGFLYCRRKSENAGVASPSGHVNTFIRTMIASVPTFAFAMFACEFILGEPNHSYGTFAYIGCIIAALLLWFLYELITTKSIKKMLKSVKTLWVLPAIVSVFILTVLGCRLWMLVSVPKADNVKSVTVYTDIYISQEEDGFKIDRCLSCGVEITGTEDIKLFTDMLDLNVHRSQNDELSSYRVVFNLKNGGQVSRIVRIDTPLPEDRTFREYLVRSCIEFYYIPPAPSSIRMQNVNHISLHSSQRYFYDFSEDEDREVFETFVNEYNGLSSKEQKLIVISYSERNSADGTIFMSDTNNSVTHFRIDLKEITPKTYQVALGILMKKLEAEGTHDDFIAEDRLYYKYTVYRNLFDSLTELRDEPDTISEMELLVKLSTLDKSKSVCYNLTKADADSEEFDFIDRIIESSLTVEWSEWSCPILVEIEQYIKYSDGTEGMRTVGDYMAYLYPELYYELFSFADN